MQKVLILSTQEGDWEAIYIGENCIDQGHTIEKGDRLYLLKKAEKYGFKSSDVIIKEANDEDDEYAMNYGSFPNQISELKGNYFQ